MKYIWPDDGQTAACPQCGAILIGYQDQLICAVCARNEAKRLQKLLKKKTAPSKPEQPQPAQQ